VKKLVRFIFYFIFSGIIKHTNNWWMLRMYPPVRPKKEILERWNRCDWTDYKRWIDTYSINTTQRWDEIHRQNLPFEPYMALSIVVPVYNTKVDYLQECILSVRYQTCPYWQLILVDDGSTVKDTLSVLKSRLCDDPRIHVIFNKGVHHGISAASNLGIAASSGNYIGFLDHDDRLAVDAVQRIYDELRENSSPDILYSDRDMISPDDSRHMYLMKPAWSPETLLSGNYLFHFVCYRKKLINQIGGLRSEYDGSQDYDLILRCSDLEPVVKHIPRVLYHWRQCEVSVSLDEGAKGYAFDAGTRALQDTLERRQIKARVSENRSLWRGNYQLEFDPSVVSSVKEIIFDDSPQVVDSIAGKQLLFFRNTAYESDNSNSINELASWLAVKGVGIVSGKCVSASKKNIYAGAVMGSNGNVLFPYRGEAITEPGYMAITQIVHNISVPDCNCFMVRPEVWEELQGFDKNYQSYAYQVYDFSLRAAAIGWRTVFNPRALFVCKQMQDYHVDQANDLKRFRDKWSEWLQSGDPYYSPNLSQESASYELRIPK
jgi:glycosyltransferase involved in cell wall biosynthesis